MALADVFPHRHVILPVIHVENEEQALRNVEIARGAGADGVFLINHSISSAELLSIQQAVVAAHSDWWVGVNCLGSEPVAVFQQIDDTVAGVWVDNAGIDERADVQVEAERILNARRRAGWTGLYFGGVAFKYQRPVEDLVQAARRAVPYMDVVTTSGPGTGRAAEVKKIGIMKEALGEHPLAIASGITPENATDYLDSADCFLVATGISQTFEELNPSRVNQLVQTIRKAR